MINSNTLHQLSAKEERLIDAGVFIRENDPVNGDKAFLTRYLVQATLPHRNPVGNPPEWHRRNGYYTLSIQPGYANNPVTNTRCCVGYPFGSLPRLLMFWITTEALRTGSNKLFVGSTMAEFLRSLGLNHRNGGIGSERSDRKRLRDQMERLFRAKISFEFSSLETASWLDMPVAPRGEFWSSIDDPNEGTFWDSWIELGDVFYNAITSAPIPVDKRVLRELKQSPLALDMYAWATYKTHQVTTAKKPQRISWKQLHAQIGTEYADMKNFKRKAREAIRKILVLYPGLRIEDDGSSFLIKPGITSVASDKLKAITKQAKS